MKIMHYFLGFPPYRTGGLTKYAFDLARAQVCNGHEVLALWPGEIKNYSSQPYIKEDKPVAGIRSLELVNPLPVPLDEGISEFEAFTRPCEISIYINFLEREKIDVIHIHTLMGMHRELLEATKQLKIRTVMTSHDYFGLCPKVTFYRYGECCDDDNECKKCVQCNLASLSLKKIQLTQSPLYRSVKDVSIVKKLRKIHRRKFFGISNLPDIPSVDVEAVASRYVALREYYVNMYELIDFIHFNSTVSESIFKKYVKANASRVISICHSEIKKEKREITCGESNKIRLLWLSPTKEYKGFHILIKALDELWDEGYTNFVLNVYDDVKEMKSYMVFKGKGYKHSDLPNIFADTDILLAISSCYETFGFTVLEALYNNVQVIVSDHVGAKDIVGQCGYIIPAENVIELKNTLLNFSKEKIQYNGKYWEDFLLEIYEIYQEEDYEK